MNYLLDTNVVSELVAKRPDARVLAWLDELDPAAVFLSVITVGEIRKGIEKLPASARKQELADWLTDELLVRFRDRVLGIDVDVMLTWGQLAGRLEQGGRSLSAIDSLLAALALTYRCVLVTRNEADFQGTGVTILNPWK